MHDMTVEGWARTDVYFAWIWERKWLLPAKSTAPAEAMALALPANLLYYNGLWICHCTFEATGQRWANLFMVSESADGVRSIAPFDETNVSPTNVIHDVTTWPPRQKRG